MRGWARRAPARGAAAAALLAAAAVCGHAAYEEVGFSPRAISMGGAFTAVHDDLAAAAYNPAALGELRLPQLGLNYLRMRHIPSGAVDLDQLNTTIGVPISLEGVKGTFAAGWSYTDHEGFALDRSVDLSYGSRGSIEFADGHLNAGMSLKLLQRSLQADGIQRTLQISGSDFKPALDLGLLYRRADRYAFGLSLLNSNGPNLAGDRVPVTLKLGVSEMSRQFSWAADFSKREPSATRRGSTSIAGGVEYWLATPRAGSFAGRMGLSLGDRLRSWNFGFGWRLLGAQFDYSMTVPMNDVTPDLSHALALSFRFGSSSPEEEYERLLDSERRLREDLSEALDSGEVKRWRFEEEIDKQRRELESLRGRLREKSSAEQDVRAKLKVLEDRHSKTVESFQRLKVETEKTQEMKFREEWAAYQSLKSSGAASSILIERVRRVLRQYKDSGVDIGEANQELLRLLRSR